MEYSVYERTNEEILFFLMKKYFLWINQDIHHYEKREERNTQRRIFVSANDLAASCWHFGDVYLHDPGPLVRITSHMNSEEYIYILSDVILPYVAEIFPDLSSFLPFRII